MRPMTPPRAPTPAELGFTELPFFDGARDDPSPTGRLKDVRRRCRAFREWMLSRDPVRFYRAFDLVRVPYPTAYALLDACAVPTPFVHILNRVTVVQFEAGGEPRTLLVSPSDTLANRRTPYFRHLLDRLGPFEAVASEWLGPVLGTVEAALARCGLHPEDVDFVSYDHLHTQDLRRWLGDGEREAAFPNARLLVTRQEWESTLGLLPPQKLWYCPDGISGLPHERVVLFDRDLELGPGMVLMRTPGHTEGNHSFVVRTPEGITVSSENGVSADSYSPRASRIPGVAAWARRTGMEVVLNGNTLEGGLDQYLSMIQEREVACPAPGNGDFRFTVPTSELSAYPLFPGIAPTLRFGELRYGMPVKTARKAPGVPV